MVGRPIGRGGSADVYAADHPKLGRIALKAIGRDRYGRQAFCNEVLGLRRLDGLGVPRLYGYGTYALGSGERIRYMMLERLDGVGLEKLFGPDDPIPAADAALLVARSALAADRLHRRGIVHRDIKPENIVIVLTDSPERFDAKLIDLGLAARPVRARSGESLACGTPPYMAPEQVLEHGHDRRTDVYALGAVLYELVSGWPVFRGSLLDLLAKTVRETPAPLREARPELDIPATLEAITAKALAKSPHERFASALELARALEELLGFSSTLRARGRARLRGSA